MAVLDYDGDGWLDVYRRPGRRLPRNPVARPSRPWVTARARCPCHEPGRPPVPQPRRRDVRGRDGAPRGSRGSPGGYGHGVAVGDYDNDGRPDLFVTRWRRTPSIATGATGRSRTPPTAPGWAATATGRPRRPSPTSTATATSTSTSATTWPGTPSNPTLCRDPGRPIATSPACRWGSPSHARPRLPQRRRPVRRRDRRGRHRRPRRPRAWASSPPTSTTTAGSTSSSPTT